ncbi:MAG: thiamine-binding protein [Chloroflexia bacterium]|nr:thiamine-binding protein [Chloroflexia bacterium]
MYVGTQVSLYPLGQQDLAPAIQDIWDALAEAGLEQQPGPMSTLVWGEDEAVLKALRQGFRRAAERGPAVVVITMTNACPLPEQDQE